MTSFMKIDALPVMIFGITGTGIFFIILAGPGFPCTSAGLLGAAAGAAAAGGRDPSVLFGPISCLDATKAATRLTRLLLNG